MKIILFILVQSFVLLVTTPQMTFAQTDSARTNPDDYSINPDSLEKLRRGYANYPVVQCPGVKTKYLEMISTLDSIKDKIRAEACPSEEKEKVEKEVANIDEILTGKKRKEFTRIVKEGLATNGEVSPAEADTVRNYIESVITTTAVITGLTDNSACFDDESQDITLATLSAIISEASSALGAITGPMGTKITLGGKVAAGLIDSVAKITMTRETYCKGLGALGIGTCKYDAAAEQAYVSNLCSYYKLKFDIDEFTNPQVRLDELRDLEKASDDQLKLLSNECSECRQIIKKFTSSIDVAHEMQDLTANTPIEFTYMSPGNLANGDWQDAIRSTSKPLYEYSYDDLLDVFNQEIRQATARYTSSASESSEPPFDTIRTLRTRAWAQYEFDRVWSIYEDDSDVALNKVGIEQTRIEDFLFVDEAPKYIRFAAKRAQSSNVELLQMIYDNFQKLKYTERNVKLLRDPNRTYSGYYGPRTPAVGFDGTLGLISDMVHDIFRGEVEYSKEFTSTLSERELKRQQQRISSRLRNLKSTIQAKLRAVKRDYAVFRDYCRLFEFGNLRFEGPVGDACILGHQHTLANLKGFFKKLEDSALGHNLLDGILESSELPSGSVLSDVNKLDPDYVRNWVTSLTAATEEQNQRIRENGLSSLAPAQPKESPSAAPPYELQDLYPGFGVR